MSTNATENENCDMASSSDWVSDRVSLFQSDGGLYVIASRQQKVGIKRSEKTSNAS